MKLGILVLLLAISLQGCQPVYKESGVEMNERCYDGVVYISNKYESVSSLSVKFNRDGTVSTKLSNGIECK